MGLDFKSYDIIEHIDGFWDNLKTDLELLKPNRNNNDEYLVVVAIKRPPDYLLRKLRSIGIFTTRNNVITFIRIDKDGDYVLTYGTHIDNDRNYKLDYLYYLDGEKIIPFKKGITIRQIT
jgi:hypothetical protein